MIPVSLSYLVLIYLVIMLSPIFGAWLYNEWQRHRRERAAFRHILRCTLCSFEFEDSTDTALPCCPRCGGLNERHRFLRL